MRQTRFRIGFQLVSIFTALPGVGIKVSPVDMRGYSGPGPRFPLAPRHRSDARSVRVGSVGRGGHPDEGALGAVLPRRALGPGIFARHLVGCYVMYSTRVNTACR